MPTPSMGVDDVRAAHALIRDRVVRTPMLRVPSLDEAAGAELFFKCENLQRIGAFKARGAMTHVSRLDPGVRAKGILTYSSGNHAQAVALAAKHFGVPATIAMPIDAPGIKVAGVRRLGAEVVFAGTTSEDRRLAALEIAERTGAAIVPPFDDPSIIAGQGTATLELVEQVSEATGGETLDAMIVPVGGGGVLAGACLASHPSTSVYAVEPHGCDAMARSLEAGERVPVEPGPTIADGLKPVMVGALNFEIARARGVTGYRVDDGELGAAMIMLLLQAKILVEPSAAAGLALALRRELPGAPRRIGIMLTGGNVDPSRVSELLLAHAAQT